MKVAVAESPLGLAEPMPRGAVGLWGCSKIKLGGYVLSSIVANGRPAHGHRDGNGRFNGHGRARSAASEASTEYSPSY